MREYISLKKTLEGLLIFANHAPNIRLADTLRAYKFGYDSLEEYKATAKERFSLLENGIFDKPSCRIVGEREDLPG